MSKFLTENQKEFKSKSDELFGVERMMFLSGMSAKDRVKILNSAENKQVIEFRKACVKSGTVTKMLGCTYNKMEKLMHAGVLPVCYTKHSYTYDLMVRFWHPITIDNAKSFLTQKGE